MMMMILFLPLPPPTTTHPPTTPRPKKRKKKKEKKKECGPTVSDGLPTPAHSPVRSHYCATRKLWPAVFPPWAGSFLLSQPGPPGLPPRSHIDAGLSADTRSSWCTCWQDSRPQTVPILGLQVAGLQEHATTPSRQGQLSV